MHSTCSDGTDTPAALLQKVRDKGIDVFSLTDHDAINGCSEITKLLTPWDAFFVPGVELNSKYHPSGEIATKQDTLCKGKYHILGYAYDLEGESLQSTVQLTHDLRMEKADKRFRFLQEEYHFTFTEEEIASVKSHSNPGRPHFAFLLTQKNYVSSINEAYDILAKYPSEEYSIKPEDAIESILQSNGIPVLAHGLFGAGEDHLSEEEIEGRVAYLKECGLMGLECYYSGFSKKEIDQMLVLAKKYELLITAGSDYHGKVKKVEMGDTHIPDLHMMMPFLHEIADRKHSRY